MYLPKVLNNYIVFCYTVLNYVSSKTITHFPTQCNTQLVVPQLQGCNIFFSNTQILLNRQDIHQARTSVSNRTEWIRFFTSNSPASVCSIVSTGQILVNCKVLLLSSHVERNCWRIVDSTSFRPISIISHGSESS